jgi:spermidine dehydrogenase
MDRAISRRDLGVDTKRFDPVYEEDDDERYPHIRARKRYGRIAIANADAGANAMFETAVEQGHRAVTELM